MAACKDQLAEQLQRQTHSTAQDTEYFYEYLERVFLQLGFLNPKAPKRLIPRMQRLFNRIRLEENEVHILRGILMAIEKQ